MRGTEGLADCGTVLGVDCSVTTGTRQRQGRLLIIVRRDERGAGGDGAWSLKPEGGARVYSAAAAVAEGLYIHRNARERARGFRQSDRVPTSRERCAREERRIPFSDRIGIKRSIGRTSELHWVFRTRGKLRRKIPEVALDEYVGWGCRQGIISSRWTLLNRCSRLCTYSRPAWESVVRQESHWTRAGDQESFLVLEGWKRKSFR